MILIIPLTNLASFSDIRLTNWFPLIYGAYFSVDVFFFLSAFLGFYLITEKLIKNKKGIFAYLFLYVHRYIRLIPAMIFMISITVWLVPYLGNGPVYYKMDTLSKQLCVPYWWTNLLFINNIYPLH